MQHPCNGVHYISIYTDVTVASAHTISPPPLKGRQSINGLQKVNMSALSASYSKIISSGDESVERGEPSKLPEPKVAPKWTPWVPWCKVPIALVAWRQVAPMLPFRLLHVVAAWKWFHRGRREQHQHFHFHTGMPRRHQWQQALLLHGSLSLAWNRTFHQQYLLPRILL